jgi:hypothetical protein
MPYKSRALSQPWSAMRPAFALVAAGALLWSAAVFAQPLEASVPESTRAELQPPPTWAKQLLTGAAATAVATPTAMLLASWMGTWSNQLVWSLAPSMVVLFVVPPLLVNGAIWITSNWGRTERYRFWPSFWSTLGTHAAVTVAAIFLGVSVGSFASAAPYVLTEMALLPLASTATMRWVGATPRPITRAPAVMVPLVSYAW